MLKIHATFLVLPMMFFFGCQKSQVENSYENQVQNVREKIDAGLYTEALDDTHSLQKKYPQTAELQVLEASVYVRKSGLTLKKYFELAELFSEQDSTSTAGVVNISAVQEKLAQLKINLSPEQNQLTEFLVRVNDSSVALKNLETKLNQIPDIPEESQADMQAAVYLLDQIKDETAGIRFYRGIINLIYFKFILSHQKVFPDSQKSFCEMPVGVFYQNLLTVLVKSEKMLTDLSAGFPKSKEAFLLRAESVKKISSEVKLRFTQLESVPQDVSFKKLIDQSYANAEIQGVLCAP